MTIREVIQKLEPGNLVEMRERTRLMCKLIGVTITPYGVCHWLHGRGISVVVADLAGVRASALAPLPVFER